MTPLLSARPHTSSTSLLMVHSPQTSPVSAESSAPTPALPPPQPTPLGPGPIIHCSAPVRRVTIPRHVMDA